MKSIIERALREIDRAKKSSSSKIEKIELKNIDNDLKQLLKSYSENFTADEQTYLFCRQLNRFLNNNDSLSFSFWIKLVGQKKNDPETFHSRIMFEKELVQRELEFVEKYQQQKNLQDFLNEYQSFFEIYLQNNISFHSKLRIFNLFDDMQKFSKDFGVKIENLTNLENELQCIHIEYDFEERILYSINVNNGFKNVSADDVSHYLPSHDELNFDKEKSRVKNIMNLLGKHRWIVILGDPGNSKTTLLRWITYKFAENTIKYKRIPILIRIGEFAIWFEQNPNKTLIDYIGEHTWFSKQYHPDVEQSRQVLKELVYQGHALILLDGLDEISDVEQIGNIVHCIENFMKEFVIAPDLISPFDEKFFEDIVETQPPSKSTGNQIIITSRIVNYKFSFILGPHIQHILLNSMEHEEAKFMVLKWSKHILNSIINILNGKKIELKKKKIREFCIRQYGFVKRIFKNKFQFLRSNSSLLFLISKLTFQSNQMLSLTSRTEIYRYTIENELQSWIKQNSPISKQILSDFLIELAFYLHLNSSSGLIDGFNLEQLCYFFLKQQNISKTHARTIINWLKSNIGIAQEQALNVYSFLYLSFQEYFVALGFADFQGRFSLEQNVQRLISFTIHPRFRESLLLAMGLISSKLEAKEYDNFCELLFTTTMNYAIPFGVLLFFDSFREFHNHKLPSEHILFQALNILFNHPCFTLSKRYFISNLNKLPEPVINRWIDRYITTDEKSFKKFCNLFLIDYDIYSSSSIPQKHRRSAIYEKLRLIYEQRPSEEFFIDQILQRTIINSYERLFIFDARGDSSSKTTPTPIISVIIGLVGNVQYFLQLQQNNTFSFDDLSVDIHRQSSTTLALLYLLYFSAMDQSNSIANLIQRFKDILDNTLSTDTSLDTIETFIALICLQGVSQPLDYAKYANYKALNLALDRFKRIWFYFRQFPSCDSTESRPLESVSKSFIKLAIDCQILRNTNDHVLTVEPLDNHTVIEQLDNDDSQLLCEFQSILNRDSIEQLFKSIQSSNESNNKKKLQAYLNRLLSICRHDQISQVEIHQQLKFTDNTNCQEQILNLLLDCSSIKHNNAQSVEIKIFTEKDIEWEYIHRSRPSPTIHTRNN